MIKKFGTQKEQDYHSVTCIDLFPKDEAMVVGYETGHIVLWNTLKTERIKTILPTEKSQVLSVKFWKDTKSLFMASNAKGMIYLYKLESTFFAWNIERKTLFDLTTVDSEKRTAKIGKTDPLIHLPDGAFSIQVLKKELTKDHELDKYTLVAIGSMKFVLIITLEPNISIVYRYHRPAGLCDWTIPSLSWGKGSLPGILHYIGTIN